MHKVSTDAGNEFQAEFAAHLKQSHIHYDKQVRSRKMIEALNRGLRRYVERVGWDLKKDLDDLITSFLTDYNNSVHSSTGQRPDELMRLKEKKDVKHQARAQHKAGKRRMAGKSTKGTGWNVSLLKVGDIVRVFDPKRREIKGEQKKKLKGKIKLSEADYIKKYTSRHPGIDPHWTKTTYKVTRIIIGRRAQRYELEGRKGAYMRSELQKVSKVTKTDPRAEIIAKRKEAKAKYKAVAAPAVRKAKYVGKVIIVNYKEENKARTEDPATVLDVYKNYLIVFHDSLEITFCNLDEVVEMTGESHPKGDVKTWIHDNPDDMDRAREEIDETISEQKEEAYIEEESD